jgi:hypothetical protein
MYRSEVFANDIKRFFGEAIKTFKEYLALNADLPYEVAFSKCYLPNNKVLEAETRNYTSIVEEGFNTYDLLSLKDIFKVSSVKVDECNNVVVVYDYNNIESVVVFTDFNLHNKMAFIEGVCIFLDIADDILHPEKIGKSYF